MANTYAFAICGALLLAVTLAPVLCSFLFVNKKEETDTLARPDHEAALPEGLELGAAPSLADARWSWDRSSAGTLFLIPHLGGEFMPPLEEGHLWIRAILPRTVSLEERPRSRLGSAR